MAECRIRKAFPLSCAYLRQNSFTTKFLIQKVLLYYFRIQRAFGTKVGWVHWWFCVSTMQVFLIASCSSSRSCLNRQDNVSKIEALRTMCIASLQINNMKLGCNDYKKRFWSMQMTAKAHNILYRCSWMLIRHDAIDLLPNGELPGFIKNGSLSICLFGIIRNSWNGMNHG